MKPTKLISIAALAATLTFGLTGCGGGGSDTSAGVDPNYTPHPYDTPPLDENTKAAYLNAINAARSVGRDCGRFGHFDPAPPLQWSDAAYRAAKEHSNDMAASGVFDHIGSNTASDWTAQVQDIWSGDTPQNPGEGSRPDQRLQNNQTSPERIGVFNELIVGATYNAQEAINAWLGSDSHCMGLMDQGVKYVGMAESDNGGYWTLLNYSTY